MTSRQERAYTTHHVGSRLALIECKHCQTLHKVDKGDPDVDFVPCQGSDDCAEMLCRDCRLQCVDCKLWACEDHMAWFEGERVCHVCLAKIMDEMGEPECQCVRKGDFEDASACPVHGEAA